MDKRKEGKPGDEFEGFEDWEGASADEPKEGEEEVQPAQGGGFEEAEGEQGDEFQEFADEQGEGEPDAEFVEEAHEGEEEAEPQPRTPAQSARSNIPPRQAAVPGGKPPQQGPAPAAPAKFDAAALDLAPDVPVQVIAIIGKRSITIKELMELRMGQVIDLKRPPNETVDVVVNGKLFARGELVEIDGKLGVRILKLVR